MLFQGTQSKTQNAIFDFQGPALSNLPLSLNLPFVDSTLAISPSASLYKKCQEYPSTLAFALAIVSSMIADLPDSCLKNYTFFRPLIKAPFSVKPPLVPLSLKPSFFPLSLVTAHFTPFRCMFCLLSIPLSGWKVKAGVVVFYFTHHWVCSQCLEHIQ